MIATPTTLQRAIVFLSLTAACLLQFQYDILATDTYAGLRLNLADLLVPVAGIMIMFSLFRGETNWPKYKIDKTYFWLGAMTLVLIGALFTGYYYRGEISAWGLHNKVLGWFLLVAYFLWGAWFAHNVKCIKIIKFFRCFVLTAMMTGLIGAIVITLQDFSLLDGVIAYPFKGLMANRNAYGFVILAATILVFFYGSSARPLLSKWEHIVFWFMLPLIHVQIGSRSCWILAIIQLGAFLFIKQKYFLKKVALPLTMGIALITFLAAIHPIANGNFIFKQNQNVQFIELPSLLRSVAGPTKPPIEMGMAATSYKSDMLRLRVNGLALELWANSPLIGTGLGTTQAEEPKHFGVFLDVIDSTPIWLLTETGLIGVSIFAAFFWLILFNLARETERGNTETRTIDYAAMGIFLTFAIMSVMHEIMYTRFLWFILGIAITIPETAIRIHQLQKDRARDLDLLPSENPNRIP